MSRTSNEQILAAAAPIFAAEGFAGASTRAIASAAGVNIATLAYHFGDKQGLYAALLDRTYERLLEVDVPLPEGDPEVRLRAIVRGLYTFARDNRTEVRVLLRHVLENERLPESVSTRWLAPMLERVQVALAPIPLDHGRLLALLSLNHLIVRYAISDDADLAIFGGQGDPHAAVGEHLAELACRMMLQGDAAV